MNGDCDRDIDSQSPFGFGTRLIDSASPDCDGLELDHHQRTLSTKIPSRYAGVSTIRLYVVRLNKKLSEPGICHPVDGPMAGGCTASSWSQVQLADLVLPGIVFTDIVVHQTHAFTSRIGALAAFSVRQVGWPQRPQGVGIQKPKRKNQHTRFQGSVPLIAVFAREGPPATAT